MIKFRPGLKNAAADALSRPEESPLDLDTKNQALLRPEWLEKGVLPPQAIEQKLSAISALLAPIELDDIQLMDRLLQANRIATDLDEEKAAAPEEGSEWSLQDGLLLFQNKLVVPEEGDLRTRLLDMVYRQPSTAHLGRTKTETLVKNRYWWPGWRHDVKRYVANCLICNRTTTRRDLPPGLLQPLDIPNRPWEHISMDFRSCPKDKHGFDKACVIVDRLTKRVISIPCHKNVSVMDMTQLFLKHIYRWVGLPESILSDRGGQFISAFWEELCLRLRIKRKLTSGQKPSTNGHTEIVNQYLAQKLRPFTARNLEQIWDYAKGQIELAQVKMKRQADKHRRPVDFKAENLVYVTIKDWELGRPSRKFGDQWAGPYEIIEQIGYAFKLRLPPTLQVYPVFVPEKLRKVTDLAPMPGQIRDPEPPIEIQGESEWLVDKILASRMYNKELRYRVQ
ncbi:integrase [Aspergillus affinis]|uniref:integrase n=1 Tax=Aspergillus affinis TaxID=1070780 RepID=UPI0022FDD79C|nr:uncharacterized protein KD926_001609 [Aspergillus affinis]KAI9036655.1 hypothetical protein KD926_001609 [Aspergillus affinis]